MTCLLALAGALLLGGTAIADTGCGPPKPRPELQGKADFWDDSSVAIEEPGKSDPSGRFELTTEVRQWPVEACRWYPNFRQRVYRSVAKRVDELKREQPRKWAFGHGKVVAQIVVNVSRTHPNRQHVTWNNAVHPMRPTSEISSPSPALLANGYTETDPEREQVFLAPAVAYTFDQMNRLPHDWDNSGGGFYEVPEPLRDETFPQGETKQVDGKVVPVVHGVYLNMEFTFGTTGAVAEDRINGRCKKAYIVLFNKREWEFVAFPPLEDQPARNDDIRPF